MPDPAIQAGPSNQLADEARKRVGNHAPEQEARNEHAEQVQVRISCGNCPIFDLLRLIGRRFREEPGTNAGETHQHLIACFARRFLQRRCDRVVELSYQAIGEAGRPCGSCKSGQDGRGTLRLPPSRVGTDQGQPA